MICFIISGQAEPTGFQLLVVDDQSGVFHMQDLHNVLLTINEYKHFTAANISVHL
jgi:hypothetical protein